MKPFAHQPEAQARAALACASSWSVLIHIRIGAEILEDLLTLFFVDE